MTVGGEQGKSRRGVFIADTPSSLETVAHELKAPLALIRQLSLELGTVHSADESIQDLAEQIQLVAEKSLRLSTNLTKANQLQATLFPTGPIHVGSVLGEVQDELAPLYLAHGRRLALRRVAHLPAVVANYDLLRRILCNFADNALHYADEQGVVELFTQLKRRQDVVRLGVRDYGPAIPLSTWKTIKSRREDTPQIHSRPDSSGLGLRIASQFAGAIGAEIGAIRHRDGATFYIDVPVTKQLRLV